MEGVKNALEESGTGRTVGKIVLRR
ncbi:hypothetical protein [Nocardiopsis alba]